MVGYCYLLESAYSLSWKAQWLQEWGFFASVAKELTFVVLTPHSKGGWLGDAAGGVSIHSNWLSDSEEPILQENLNFARCFKRTGRLEGFGGHLPSRNGVETRPWH